MVAHACVNYPWSGCNAFSLIELLPFSRWGACPLKGHYLVQMSPLVRLSVAVVVVAVVVVAVVVVGVGAVAVVAAVGC